MILPGVSRFFFWIAATWSEFSLKTKNPPVFPALKGFHVARRLVAQEQADWPSSNYITVDLEVQLRSKACGFVSGDGGWIR